MKKTWLIASATAALLAAVALIGGRAWTRTAILDGTSPEEVSLPEDGSCLRIDIAHDDTKLGGDGVKTRSLYTDHMIRCDGFVWTERQLPAGTANAQAEEAHHEHAGHSHKELPPLYRLAKLIRREGSEVRLSLVDKAGETEIEIPRDEFDSVGFDGNYEAAASLLREATRARMKVEKTDTKRGTRVLVRTVDESRARVVWSDRLALPLEIETGTSDGRSISRMTFQISSQDRNLVPWKKLERYRKAQISDFRD